MKTILVVDDSAMIRELLDDVLKAEGYDVVLAADGEEAVDLWKSHDVDLSIVDIFLPRKGGLQVISEVLKSDKKHKIIAISGGESFHPQTILELANIFEVAATFTKPIDTARLVATVKGVLGN
jgi:two-component system, OmpR family, response regulator CpxR